MPPHPRPLAPTLPPLHNTEVRPKGATPESSTSAHRRQYGNFRASLQRGRKIPGVSDVFLSHKNIDVLAQLSFFVYQSVANAGILPPKLAQSISQRRRSRRDADFLCTPRKHAQRPRNIDRDCHPSVSLASFCGCSSFFVVATYSPQPALSHGRFAARRPQHSSHTQSVAAHSESFSSSCLHPAIRTTPRSGCRNKSPQGRAGPCPSRRAAPSCTRPFAATRALAAPRTLRRCVSGTPATCRPVCNETRPTRSESRIHNPGLAGASSSRIRSRSALHSKCFSMYRRDHPTGTSPSGAARKSAPDTPDAEPSWVRTARIRDTCPAGTPREFPGFSLATSPLRHRCGKPLPPKSPRTSVGVPRDRAKSCAGTGHRSLAAIAAGAGDQTIPESVPTFLPRRAKQTTPPVRRHNIGSAVRFGGPSAPARCFSARFRIPPETSRWPAADSSRSFRNRRYSAAAFPKTSTL